MSDKYYLHDCNSQGHYCSNTYRSARKEVVLLDEDTPQDKHEKSRKIKWWQRLLDRDAQQARA